jgi:aminotransferase
VILSGAVPRYVALRPPDWTFDVDELRAAFSERTRAIIICNPGNPTGNVFTREQLDVIAGLCQEYDAIAVTDEIYEHILFDGAEHVAIATLPGMRERTVTVNSLSKTYSVTGWRVGYVIAPPDLSGAIRKVHDFLTVGAAAPLQEAGAVALGFGPEYYEKLQRDYLHRRDLLLPILERVGFRCYRPRGAYYIITDIADFGFGDDIEFSRHMVERIGVAVVPGSSFYSRSELGRTQVRFCFCKQDETLNRAAERLARLA